MSNKEVYCLYRAQYLHTTFGKPLIEGWQTAENEWHTGLASSKPKDYEADEYDDNVEDIPDGYC